jgi:hypothetical protein
MRAADPPVRREEALLVALLLGFAGGYLDTYTWITHGILANAQTANLVFLWVHATALQWQQAFHFVPPLFAFAVGVVVAAWLRRVAGSRAGRVSLIIEIGMLILVGILHNRVPGVAGTLGISMVAAMQTSIFTKVEGSTYSSVMITGPATAAALHAVSSAPCMAPTLSGPKMSARNAGMVAKPPPYIVNTTNRHASNTAQLPLAASSGISRKRTNCATKKIVYVWRRPM